MATTNHSPGALITIPARAGKAVSIRQGQAVKVVNTHGAQVVDTWAFSAEDVTEFMSMDATRATICKIRRQLLFQPAKSHFEPRGRHLSRCPRYVDGGLRQ